MTQYLLSLKKKVEGQNCESIFAHPAFEEALEEMQHRLQQEKAAWHGYDEVFGD